MNKQFDGLFGDRVRGLVAATTLRLQAIFRKSVHIALAWAMLAASAQASTVLPLYLDELVASAAVAFQGTCTANRTELEPQTGFVVTYTTFTVTDVLKGTVGSTHTIKQLGGQTEKINYRVEGGTTFAVGGDYVVFLYGVSSAGFSSPVGLSQGQFTVRQGANGAELSNGRDFKEMLRPYSAKSLPQGAQNKIQQAPEELKHFGLDDFKQIVRQQTGGAK
ncbi:MAG: hypothetical protein Q8P42_00785 [Gallionella sp.]|nr:hypothetical protein [Gallionella sp.]